MKALAVAAGPAWFETRFALLTMRVVDQKRRPRFRFFVVAGTFSNRSRPKLWGRIWMRARGRGGSDEVARA